MREIKFRAWATESGEFDYYDMARHDDHEAYTVCNLNSGPIEQYTGLNDCNDVEIYEGDLIENESGRICIVAWHQPSGAWDANPTNDDGDSIGFNPRNWSFSVEIIGNIHENQEGK